MSRGRAIVAVAGALAAFLGSASPAQASTATLNTRVTMSDGVALAATVTGQAPLTARPVIVEFSPYGPGTGTTHDGTAYNYLLIQDRGTGDSPGAWDALGPQTQEDVQQTLSWACHQPWSNGNLGLNGFSASAITIYNSLHLTLPCVKVAVLKSGTYSLYRDLLYPGGVNNFVPGLGVLGLIGGLALAQGPARLEPNPVTGVINGFDTGIGLIDVGLSDLGHPTLDSFWQARQYQGDANHFPILMVDSFYDVESQGAFDAFQALRGVGDHLLVLAGHDGYPAGTDGGVADIKDWFDHYLLGIQNAITEQPRVQMLMSDGSRETYDAGHDVPYDASNWPVPGTQWESLALSSAHSTGSSSSLNNGTLTPTPPAAATTQSYVAIPSAATMSDEPTTAFLGGFGLNTLADALPLLTETNLTEPLGLTYTTPPLSSNQMAAGPAALDIRLASTATATDIWAVISDVWPNGTSHPVASGRLNSSFPEIIPADSLTDAQGAVVAPWNNFTDSLATPPGTARTYQLAFWPIGNEFRAGDRVRLTLLGASAFSLPSAPAINSVTVGGPDGSRLLLPVLPAEPQPCPTATGTVTSQALGPLRLGMTRAAARGQLPRSPGRGGRYLDVFCLTPTGIRAGYPAPKVLAGLPSKQRVGSKGRIVLLLSANPDYALGDARPGVKLAAVAAALRIRQHFWIGRNDWYLLNDAGSGRGVLKVRAGLIEEVGIANARLTAQRAAARRFMSSFN